MSDALGGTSASTATAAAVLIPYIPPYRAGGPPGRPSVPHLAMPFALAADGSAAVVAGDSLADVAQCVSVLIQTFTRSRLVVPDYGIPDPTFAGPDATAIAAAIATWEPRAAVSIVISPPGDDGVGQLGVQVGLKGAG